MYHYRDLLNDDESWRGLLIQGNWPGKGRLKVYSSPNYRIKLMLDGQPILWASASHDYWGVWQLPNLDTWTSTEELFPPIRSREVEEGMTEDEYYRKWSRYFVRNLSNLFGVEMSDTSWQLNKGYVRWNKNCNSGDLVDDVATAFWTEIPSWTPWHMGGDRALTALRAIQKEDSGRIKWYRKLVRQDSCPPILVWHFSATNGHLLLDGHCRLKAYLLEEKQPRFLILSELIYTNIVQGSKKGFQRGIERSIAQRQQHPYKAPLAVDKVNSLLIAAYDERPVPRMITRAKFEYDEQVWLREVKEACAKSEINQEHLKMMIEREGL